MDFGKFAGYMKTVLSSKEIGQRIKQRREASDLSVIKLAKRARLTRQHWYNIEKGKVGLTVDVLQRVGRVIGVGADELLKPAEGN